MMQTMMYYGKKYGLVFSSTSRRKTNVFASVINNYFRFEYGKKEGSAPGTILFINHDVQDNGTIMHHIFVKKPYDRLIKKVK